MEMEFTDITSIREAPIAPTADIIPKLEEFK